MNNPKEEEAASIPPRYRLSCTDCFDALWFCYCTQQSNALLNCLLSIFYVICTFYLRYRENLAGITMIKIGLSYFEVKFKLAFYKPSISLICY